jgi:hypothetical protein
MVALDVATGKVTDQMAERHRSRAFLAFLYRAAGGIAPGVPKHVILANISSLKSAEVNEWLKDRSHWTFHFTPTSTSWMNAVEGFFSHLSGQGVKHGLFIPLDARIGSKPGPHQATRCQ